MNWLYPIVLLPFLLSLTYVVWQWRNFWSWQEAKNHTFYDAQAATPRLAILIPFRNEAANLAAILADINAFTYPNIEVLFIDDHSDDGGADIVGAAAGSRVSHLEEAGGDSIVQVRLLHLSDHLKGRAVKAYKKEALAYAIQETSAELLVTTDADCRLPADFPEAIVRAFAAGNDVVCGPVLIPAGNSMLTNFQALDLAAYQLYTASCVARQHPTLANGACFAFRKSLFSRVAGYAGMDHLPSGDDVLLLHKFAQLPEVTFGWHDGSPVYTRPTGSWEGLWRQRIRWAGKAGAYVSPALQIGQALAYLTALAIIIALVAGLSDGRLLIVGLLSWLLKAGIDYLLLADIVHHYQQDRLLRWYIPTQLLYPIYLVAIGTGALLGLKASWKGRG